MDSKDDLMGKVRNAHYIKYPLKYKLQTNQK